MKKKTVYFEDVAEYLHMNPDFLGDIIIKGNEDEAVPLSKYFIQCDEDCIEFKDSRKFWKKMAKLLSYEIYCLIHCDDEDCEYEEETNEDEE